MIHFQSKHFLILCLFVFISNSVFPEGAKKQDKKESVEKNTTPVPVALETSLGKIEIELYPKEAPITVENFLKYVDDGFYNGTIFHRVVPGFVVQGGGHTFDFQRKKTNPPIKNESSNGLKNLKTTLSMARTSNPDSATSQFFINLVDNKSLDHGGPYGGYAVFGKVTKGFDIVKKIESEPRGIHRMHPEAPNYAVIIEKAYRITNSK